MSVEKLFGEFYSEENNPASAASSGKKSENRLQWPLLIVGCLLLVAGIARVIHLPQMTQLVLPKKVYASSEGVVFSLPQTNPAKLTAVVVSQNGTQSPANVMMQKDGRGTKLTVEPPANFIPGKYTISIYDSTSNVTYKQDFMWGVLAVNTNKSTYLPNERAKLSLAVLDETGMMVCDADVTLQIANSKLHTADTLSTKNGTITVNPECKIKDYTEKPDYEAVYTVGDIGKYEMTLTARTKNGTYSITDAFEVREQVPFDVERTTVTRIYPIKKYPVTITITANRDFEGDIVERVPVEFEITHLSKSYTETRKSPSRGDLYNYDELIFHEKLKKGESASISYTYKSPEKSPYFFTLGPLRFLENGKTIYSETRRWQIAVDAVATAVEQQVNIIDQNASTSTQTYGPSDNSLGLVKYDGTKYNGETAYFEADMKATVNKTGADVGQYNAISCPSASDCKIAYLNLSEGSLRFMDCDNTACSSGTATVIDGAVGCSITGCSTSDNLGQYVSIDCSSGASDCKIAYFDSTVGNLYFIDCDNATCSSGTRTLLDGGSGCTLTGCNTSGDVGQYTSIKCPSATNCKIAYYDVGNTDLWFADCDDATCSTGTASKLDGGSGCVITGCSTNANTGNYASVSCPASSDCKIAYENQQNIDLYFIDCDAEACTSGTRSLLDGNAGCLLTNCSSSSVGLYASLVCLTAADCKIGYAQSGSSVRFADCDDAQCSTGTVTQNVDGLASCKLTGCSTSGQPGTNMSMYCVSATDCKLSYTMSTIQHIFFADCDDAQCTTGTRTVLDFSASCVLTSCSTTTGGEQTSVDCVGGSNACTVSYGGNSMLSVGSCTASACGTGTATRADGTGAGYQDVGSYNAMTCPTSSTCKIVYYNTTDTSLKFMSCNDSLCRSHVIVTLDGAPDCVITGCSTTDDTGRYTAITCPSDNNCKVSYYNNTNGDLYFVDCDARTCNTGSRNLLDGAAGCVLTNCSTGANNVGQYTSIQCPASDNCKVSYYHVTKHALTFADCDSETCGSGTVTLLDGTAGCTLTSCSTANTVGQHDSMYCVSSTDCKIAYYNASTTSSYFADCDTETCSSGSRTLLDGDTGCVLTGCVTSASSGSVDGWTDCSLGATSCVISYLSGGGLRAAFCSAAACTSGTTQNIDGASGCVITSCDTTAGYGNSKIDCSVGASDCKIAFIDSVHNALVFIDCDASLCASGTRNYVDGSFCVLTGCDSTSNPITSYEAFSCVAGASSCQMAYYASTKGDLGFAQCSSVNCSAGIVSTIDGISEYVTAMLYTSSGTAIPDAIVSTASAAMVRMRSAALSLTDFTNYTVRDSVSETTSNLTGYIPAARIVVVQSAPSVTDSETQIELGDNETTTSSSYGQLSGPKIYLFDSNNFAGTVTASFEATLKGSAGGVTATAALSSSSTCSSTVSGSDVAVTGTTWTLSRSSTLTLSDNTEYWVCLKTSSGTASIANAKLLIDQTNGAGLDKMQVVQQMVNTPVTDADTTYTSQNYFNNLAKVNFAGGTVAYYFESTMKTSAGTGYSNLYNSTAGSAVTGGELTTSSTSYARVRSSDLASSLTNQNDYDTQLKNSASNTTSVASSWIIVAIGSGAVPTNTPTPTFVPDSYLKGSMRLKGNLRFL